MNQVTGLAAEISYVHEGQDDVLAVKQATQNLLRPGTLALSLTLTRTRTLTLTRTRTRTRTRTLTLILTLILTRTRTRTRTSTLTPTLSLTQAKHNLLRPETVESLFVMWRVTGRLVYREWGWAIFSAFETHCRVQGVIRRHVVHVCSIAKVCRCISIVHAYRPSQPARPTPACDCPTERTPCT